jgi:hypothetical protein
MRVRVRGCRERRGADCNGFVRAETAKFTDYFAVRTRIKSGQVGNDVVRACVGQFSPMSQPLGEVIPYQGTLER